MLELMRHNFAFDGAAATEISVFHRPCEDFSLFCSKRPLDINFARTVLALDRNSWFIFMMRDPRDIVVSRYAGGNGVELYWANLGQWRSRTARALRLADHPRMMIVRYEDLVCDPNAVQETIAQRLPFLPKIGNFSDYYLTAHPSKQSLRAMRGVRPITDDSVGAWRSDKSRLVGQIDIHGPIGDDLIGLGYEQDKSWEAELDGVPANREAGRWPERNSALSQVQFAWTYARGVATYVTAPVVRRLEKALRDMRRNRSSVGE